jgi:Tol biopolymer transport system component
MKKKTFYLIYLTIFILNPMNLSTISAQELNTQSGVFEHQSDIGNVKLPGNTTYNPEDQSYSVEGSGKNIWFGNDEFHYVWKKIKGDFILTAQVEFSGKGVEAHRKKGWMVRQSLDPGSPHISAVIHGDGLTSLQYRRKTGGDMEEKRMTIQGPDIIQFSRSGNTYRMSVAHWGEPFVTEELIDSTITDEAYIGLFICSHNPDVSEKAIFRNVRIEIPAGKDLVPYKDYLGSNLETMEVESGKRKIIYQVPYSIQAPNWTPDGKTLIFNSKGLLYNFDLATGKPKVLNTGFATNNNNDHVLSFDGKLIGISHHNAEDKNQSVIYYVPVKGGKPTRITANSPSYLHGWSPDNKFLIYTGGRNDEFNIYKIPVSGGKEIQITHTKGLDDGSEYSPDGKYIYFNSSRTGNMQIWRMKPDGSDQEQITFDSFNNWFPHVSPDGKSIVFITFLNDVKPTDHPFYKQVYLRIMHVNGGQSKVIAYLYGGQGTINVPSWSPDSKKIAFVSNSDFK